MDVQTEVKKMRGVLRRTKDTHEYVHVVVINLARIKSYVCSLRQTC